jgi:DNA-binding MarR family transcriptional regulator
MISTSNIVRVTRTTHRGREDGDRYVPIIADFRAAMSELKCASSQRLLRHGISMAQLHILTSVQRRGEMTMSQLADILDVSLSSATGLVDRIEERGLLERARIAEDRRVVLIRLTPAGVQLLEEVDALTDEILRTVLRRLDRGQLIGVAQAVSDLRAALSALPGSSMDRHTTSTTTPRSSATVPPATGPSGGSRAVTSLAATSRKD